MTIKTQENLTRMTRLAEDYFGTRTDTSQISITKKVMRRLKSIHPNTLSEKKTSYGPIAWIIVIPTTKEIMEQFISKQVNERELLDKTPLHKKYDAVYLCSALVLPEYRGQGFAKSLFIDAINSIKRTNPIAALFYWPFSPEGERLAISIAKEFKLSLLKRVLIFRLQKQRQ